jgi:hypothetical protein
VCVGCSAICIKRDREQVLEIALEQNTPILLKSMISVFYGAISKIADAANLADRLGDLQAFNDDLLAVLAGPEEKKRE